VAELYNTKGGAAEGEAANVGGEVLRYLKAATKATNDKYARVDRAEVIAKILESTARRPSKAVSKPTRKGGKRA
jgi:hypothetical protein